MTYDNFKSAYALAKKGQFTKATWQSVKVIKGIECRKVSNGVIRFVQYSHIKGVNVANKANPNQECLIDNALYYNAKTNNYLVRFATTTIKPHSKYYLNGEEVSKEEFEKIKAPSNVVSPVFNVLLENLIELGN